ncbi:MAG: YbaK/EbsC family protein [Anaerolineales bacterium]|nr:YbaK/EbsC family protein [Anaerolineales bacterium]
MKKTQPIRALEAKGVCFETLEQSQKEYTAQGVAADLGVETARVLKAMLVRFTRPERPSPGGNFAMFVTPGDRRLSMKKVAETLGDKNADLASERDVERISGFQVGSVSVLGLRRDDTPTYFDEHVLELDQVIISAGRPDLGIQLAPSALIEAIDSPEIGNFCE